MGEPTEPDPRALDFESEPTVETEPHTGAVEKVERAVPLPRAARGTLPLAALPIEDPATRRPTTPPVLPSAHEPAAPPAESPLVFEPSSDERDLPTYDVDGAEPTALLRVTPLRSRVMTLIACAMRRVRRLGRANVASDPVYLPIASVPAGACVTLIADGSATVAGRTPLTVALDPARTYDVVLALRNHTTTIHHIKPRIATALMVQLSSTRAPR